MSVFPATSGVKPGGESGQWTGGRRCWRETVIVIFTDSDDGIVVAVAWGYGARSLIWIIAFEKLLHIVHYVLVSSWVVAAVRSGYPKCRPHQLGRRR